MAWFKKLKIEGKPVTFNTPRTPLRVTKRIKRLKQHLATNPPNPKSYELELAALEIEKQRNELRDK